MMLLLVRRCYNDRQIFGENWLIHTGNSLQRGLQKSLTRSKICQSSKPAVLKNPTLLLTLEGRPMKRQARSRAASGLPMRSQKSLTGARKIKRRKCCLCGQVNAGHDCRNCSRKQLQAGDFLEALPPVGHCPHHGPWSPYSQQPRRQQYPQLPVTVCSHHYPSALTI